MRIFFQRRGAEFSIEFRRDNLSASLSAFSPRLGVEIIKQHKIRTHFETIGDATAFLKTASD